MEAATTAEDRVLSALQVFIQVPCAVGLSCHMFAEAAPLLARGEADFNAYANAGIATVAAVFALRWAMLALQGRYGEF